MRDYSSYRARQLEYVRKLDRKWQLGIDWAHSKISASRVGKSHWFHIRGPKGKASILVLGDDRACVVYDSEFSLEQPWTEVPAGGFGDREAAAIRARLGLDPKTIARVHEPYSAPAGTTSLDFVEPNLWGTEIRIETDTGRMLWLSESRRHSFPSEPTIPAR